MTSCASILAIFKSTLPRRERHSDAKITIFQCNFNPRSREGSDASGNQKDRFLSISIHAPAKGATKERAKQKFQWIFQSTLPRRERLPSSVIPPFLSKFQSTLPRRERRSLFLLLLPIYNFNPRSREGSDSTKKIWYLRIWISIHAPAKGATRLEGIRRQQYTISIHAPAKGATSLLS